MMTISVSFHQQSWPLAQPFRISRGVKTHADTIIVSIVDGNIQGLGEAVPYARYGESCAWVIGQISSLGDEFSSLSDLAHHIEALPAGAARNALDCALWDFRAKAQSQSVARMLQLPLNTLTTAQTISLGTADAMAAQAKRLAHAPLIKIKLDGNSVLDKMKAIHLAAPRSKFIVDANEAWSFELLQSTLPTLKTYNVVLIEQPLPADDDHQLEVLSPCIPICADESCHTRHDLNILTKRYQAINIKLDKTGGLTEAFALLNEAKQRGFIIMTGCMVASSLAMAPAFLIAQHADFVDLDGPLLLQKDIEFGFTFSGTQMSQPTPFIWGEAANKTGSITEM